MQDLDRRGFLRAAALATGASLMPLGLARSALAQSKRKTKHVILVAFAGGVRSKDTIGTPENVPNLIKIAKEGVILPRVAARNLGHYGSALALFTGQLEEKAAKENDRSSLPTVFEYARKQKKLDPSQVWLATSGGDQQLNYGYGLDADYGARFGPTPVGGDGVFNAEFKGLVEKFGRPRAEDPKDRDRVDELQHALQPAQVAATGATTADAPASDPASSKRFERAILEEISGSTTALTGTGAGDARAIRVAKSVLTAFRPTLLGIALSNADVAHGSVGAYIEVIKRNDQELGALWATVQGDPELKATTTIIVIPEMGRDEKANKNQGLDHSESSPDVLEVACFAAGPDFRHGAVVNQEVRTTQICPTVCDLLGIQADKIKEKPIREMFA